MAHILIVEDDSFLVRMYTSKFTEIGFSVDVAYDGLEGLKLAMEKRPDLILLDLMLPQLNGIEVLKKLKQDEQTKSIPVILLTNVSEKQEIEKGLSLGAADYLIKAYFTPSEVVGRVKEVLKEASRGNNQ